MVTSALFSYYDVLLHIQHNMLESETAELDARQKQLDVRLTKLNKQVTVMLSCQVYC